MRGEDCGEGGNQSAGEREEDANKRRGTGGGGETGNGREK